MPTLSVPTQAWLGLGSNVGDKQANLSEAIRRLQTFADVNRISSLYKTEPVGYLDQDWFLNAAVGVRTALDPEPFLRTLLEVERSMGRVRTMRDGPRIIDLDLLLWGDLVLDQPGLTLPHPRLSLRRFVLEPLREIAADVAHPLTHMTIEELAAALEPGADVELWPAASWPPDASNVLS